MGETRTLLEVYHVVQVTITAGYFGLLTPVGMPHAIQELVP